MVPSWRSAPARPAPRRRPGSSGGQGRPVRVRRHASRPDGEVRQGRCDADVQEADEGRRDRRQRHAPGLPAEHRCRAGSRWRRGRTRPSTARRTTPSFRGGDTFSNRTSFSAAGVLQADTIANAAERAGKKVAQIDWVGGAAADINGPTVDFTNFFSNRGVLVGAADPVEQAGLRRSSGRSIRSARVAPRPAGRTSPPAIRRRRRRRRTLVDPVARSAAQNPNRTYNVYFYDSVGGRRGPLRPRHRLPGREDRSGALDRPQGGRLHAGQADGANGLIGARAGQTVGHYVKLISLDGDLSQFKLYDTSLARAIATCRTQPATRLPAGGAGEDRLEKYIADNLLPWAAADFAPLEARRRRRGDVRPAGP